MTISNQIRRASHTGNGAATVFPYTFPIRDAAHIAVYLLDIATNLYTQLSGASYSVSGIDPDSTGGSVTYPLSGPPITSATKLIILRILPYVQETSIRNQGGFYPEVIERALDDLTMMTQQLSEDTSRAIKVPFGSVGKELLATTPGAPLTINSAGDIVSGSLLSGSVATAYMAGVNGATDNQLELQDVVGVAAQVKTLPFITPSTPNLTTAIQNALDQAGAVYLTPEAYNFGTGTINLPTGTKFIGAGAERTIISYSGNAVPINGTTLKHNQISGFSLQGNANALDGIKILGIWHSLIADIWAHGFPIGAGIHLIGNAVVGGTYYNLIQGVRSGKLGAGNLYGFNIETNDGGLQRANNNTFLSCQAQYSGSHGFRAQLCNTVTLIGCNGEVNAGAGVHAGQVTDLSVISGYYENNTLADIYLNTGTSRTTVDRPRLASTVKIGGPLAGATGDRYSTADDVAPGPTDYENWQQNLYINALASGTITMQAFAVATNQIFMKLSADAQYRLIMKNTGDLLFGGGAVAFDTTVSRKQLGLMTVNSGVVPAEHFACLSANAAKTDTSNSQAVFGAFDATLVANQLYRVECEYTIARTAGTNAHTTALGFAGTAGIGAMHIMATVSQGAGNAASAPVEKLLTVAANTVVGPSNSDATENVRVKLSGVVRITTAGTFWPTYAFSAAPGGVPSILAGATIRMYALGTDSVTSSGEWA